MWIIKKSKDPTSPNVGYFVGYYFNKAVTHAKGVTITPSFYKHSTFSTIDDAERTVNYLNGGGKG